MSAIAISEPRQLRHRRASRARFDHGQPIGRIDTLPILLFLFCMVATVLALYERPPHALTIDLPMPTLVEQGTSPEEEMAVLRIGVNAQGIATFNSLPVTRSQLGALLSAAAGLERMPGVVFRPDRSARYEDALEVLGVIKRAGLAGWQFCFGGLEDHRRFDKAPFYKPLRLTTAFRPPAMMPAPPPPPPECDPRRLYVESAE